MKKNKIIWLKKILRYICVYKKEIYIVMICLMFVSIATFLQPLCIRILTDDGLIKGNLEIVMIYTGLFFLIGVLENLIRLIQVHYFIIIHNKLSFRLNKQAFRKIYRLPISYYDEKDSAEIINTVANDIQNIVSLTDSVSAFSITSILQIITGTIGLFVINWKMVFILIIALPIKMLFVKFFSKKKSQLFSDYIEENRKYYAWLGDKICGIREMKVWNLFSKQFNELKSFQMRMMMLYKENSIWDQRKQVCESIVDVMITCMLYIVGAIFVKKGQMTIGSIMAFITYSGYIMAPITSLLHVRYILASIKPSAERFFSFLDLPEETHIEGKEEILNSGKSDYIIEMNHVYFRYKDGKQVLNDINLKIRKGEKVGIIGANGSGKSTLLELLLYLNIPTSGSIKFNGTLFEEYGAENIRKKISVVSQKTYLYNTTVEKNINLFESKSEKEVRDAVYQSGALEFINKLENGYAQNLGKDGVKLSGGEKQKIAVARALLKGADLLLLDEATTGYDYEANQNLNQLLRQQFLDKTIIVITHKYEELKDIDSLYELSDGKLLKIRNINGIGETNPL